ncbi:hypothetical protein ScPMuIL_017598 [Solemya velum]
MASAVVFYEPNDAEMKLEEDIPEETRIPKPKVEYKDMSASDKRKLFRTKAAFISRSVDSEDLKLKLKAYGRTDLLAVNQAHPEYTLIDFTRSKQSNTWSFFMLSFDVSKRFSSLGYASITDSDASNRASIEGDIRPKRASWKTISSKQSFATLDYPSFDDLFEGVTRVTISESFKDLKIDSEPEEPAPEVLVIDDDTQEADQSEKNVFVDSLSGTTGFFGFRRRLGNTLHDKVNARCRVDCFIMSAIYAMYGMFITSAGVVCLVTCMGETLVAGYLLVDGILSVFVFPLLLMGWCKRIGGYIESSDKSGKGVFWGVTLIVRLLTLIAGTFLLYERYELMKIDDWTNMCFLNFIIMLMSIMIEWTAVVVFLVIPTIFYVFVYYWTVCGAS